MMHLCGYKSMDCLWNSPLSAADSLRHCLVANGGTGRIPSRDTTERILANIPPESLKQILWDTARKACRNGVFKANQIDGKTIGILDGTTLYHSKHKQCSEHCLTTHHRNGTVTYSHKAVVLSVPCIGGTGHLVLGYDLLNAGDPTTKDEGELTGAKRVLSELGRQLPGKIDIITGDALYANAPCINAILKLGAAAVIRVKGDQRLLIKEADRRFDSLDASRMTFRAQDRRGEHILVIAEYADDFTMPGVDKALRMVRFTEIPIRADGTLDKRTHKNGELRREETTSYMLCTDPEIDIVTVWKIKHYRWDIENCCFNVLSKCFSLKHLYSHKAAEQMFALKLLAFNMRALYLFRHRFRDFAGGRYKQEDFIRRLQLDLDSESVADMLSSPLPKHRSGP